MDTSRLLDVGKCALAAGKVDQALTILTAASGNHNLAAMCYQRSLKAAAGPQQQGCASVDQALTILTAASGNHDLAAMCYQRSFQAAAGPQQQGCASTEAQDANSKRAAKIERFKADKALKAQLAVLEQRRAAGTRGRPDEDGTEQGPTGGADGWDEGEERQLWITQLQLAALQALGQRSLLQEEAKMVPRFGGASHHQQQQ
ncbi:Pp2a regulatory subunit tap46 [Haematococcus lacustris]|uniref:Pp2a regulatory subunit tap46 n=1 Tax=Haematococcus lacustris TaxID=44745 RepID=A0A6A0A8M3_HAELA|nr:Pp2a regulatory subunit tap46 [Haematococcus lacustris]